MKARAEATTFERLGLSPGTVLTFTKDPTVTCTVAGARKVEFRGQELSLSAAALLAVHEMGFDWTTIRGPEYWAYNDVKLSAMATVAPEVV